MPMDLKYFSVRKKKIGDKTRTIPKRDWDGKGYYYHRGKGKWQKYSRSRDMKRGGKVGSGKARHTHDKKK